MTQCIRDAYKAGGKGAVADYRLEAKPWKGDYVAALAALDNVEDESAIVCQAAMGASLSSVCRSAAGFVSFAPLPRGAAFRVGG